MSWTSSKAQGELSKLVTGEQGADSTVHGTKKGTMSKQKTTVHGTMANVSGRQKRLTQ